MADFATGFVRLAFQGDHGEFDLVTVDGALAADGDLESAIYTSLFTWRRAPDGTLPPGEDQRGWWGDSFPEVEGYELGSLLWTLSGKDTPEERRKAKKYAEDALAWLLEDGVASSVDVLVEAQGEVLAIGVWIQKPGERAPRWFGTWDALGRRLGSV